MVEPAITNPENWDDYIKGTIFNGNYQLTIPQLEQFSESFYKIPYATTDIINNLQLIPNNISPKSKFVIILGSELKVTTLRSLRSYSADSACHCAFVRRFIARSHWQENGHANGLLS